MVENLREVVAPGEEPNVNDLIARTGLSVPQCLAGVEELVDMGWLEQTSELAWRLPVHKD